MNVTNCRMCGRLFNVLSTERLCPECRKKLDEKFQEVKQYLEEHRDASVDSVSKECDVSVKQITAWIREERLTFSENSIEGIACENCGKMIRTGRFCDQCKNRLANTLMSAMDKRPSSDKKNDTKGNHMRYL